MHLVILFAAVMDVDVSIYNVQAVENLSEKQLTKSSLNVLCASHLHCTLSVMLHRWYQISFQLQTTVNDADVCYINCV